MMNERTAGRISEARTVGSLFPPKSWTARSVPAVPAPPVSTVGVRPRFLAELKAARVIYLAMWCRRAMMMMTRIGG